MVCSYDKQRVFSQAAFFVFGDQTAEQLIRMCNAVKVSFGTVAGGMTCCVAVVKLEKQQLGVVVIKRPATVCNNVIEFTAVNNFALS